MTNFRPRFSEQPFPPYSYVPGHAHHPVSDPNGHMHGELHKPADPLNPDAWRSSPEYLYGLDLFNHGYYWEAHEAWESLWHAAGRRGPLADFLKGLIKLAASAVKAREGNPRGVSRHAERAIELFRSQASNVYCGLSLARLIDIATTLSTSAESYSQPNPDRLLDTWLNPVDT